MLHEMNSLKISNGWGLYIHDIFPIFFEFCSAENWAYYSVNSYCPFPRSYSAINQFKY